VTDDKNRPAGSPQSDAALRAPEVARLFREHNRTLFLYVFKISGNIATDRLRQQQTRGT
jgi:hypothetical protein